MVLPINVNDCIMISPKDGDISDFIQSLQNGPEKFYMTDEGEIVASLRVFVKFNPDGSFQMKQAYLVQKVNDKVGLDEDASGKPSIAILPMLHKDMEGMEHHQ